ncbi:MAG: hypothetical protein AMS22_12040 [Thiotrichales bacterium SG8_50]|nr:MAG: hypothetical protein AMS22_12040 [Thiotrichales bacterium SG8_50]
MNSLFLLITAAIAFIFGYRFYSKLIASVVFRLDPKYSIAGPKSTTDTTNGSTNRYLLMFQHFGLVATAATLSTAALATYWGWVPAFLWAVVGTALAAGIYGIGVLWLSAHHPNESLAEVVQHYFRPRLWNGLLALLLLLLIVTAALLALLATRLLVNHPSIVAPFWIQVLLASGLGIFLSHRSDKAIAPAYGAGLVAVVILLLIFSSYSVGFSGAIYLDLVGRSRITLDADLAWIVLLAVYLYYSQRESFASLLRPRAGFAAALFILLLLVFFVGVIVAHPVLIAPGFNPAGTSPTALPWLVVTISGGALAGIYLLFAHQFTAPALRTESDCRPVGYGTAVLEGLAAISSVLICSAGFASMAEWDEFYSSWSALQDPTYLLELYINGFAYFASYLGIGVDFATNLAAVALLALTVTSLEAVLRLLRTIFGEAGTRLGLPIGPNSRRSLVFLLVVVVLITASATNAEVSALVPLYGGSNLLLAAFGMLLLVVALERRQRPGQLLLGITLIVLPAILWAIGLQLGDWWSQEAWSLVLLSLLLFAFGLWILVETVQILWKPGNTGGEA